MKRHNTKPVNMTDDADLARLQLTDHARYLAAMNARYGSTTTRPASSPAPTSAKFKTVNPDDPEQRAAMRELIRQAMNDEDNETKRTATKEIDPTPTPTGTKRASGPRPRTSAGELVRDPAKVPIDEKTSVSSIDDGAADWLSDESPMDPVRFKEEDVRDFSAREGVSVEWTLGAINRFRRNKEARGGLEHSATGLRAFLRQAVQEFHASGGRR